MLTGKAISASAATAVVTDTFQNGPGADAFALYGDAAAFYMTELRLDALSI